MQNRKGKGGVVTIDRGERQKRVRKVGGGRIVSRRQSCREQFRAGISVSGVIEVEPTLERYKFEKGWRPVACLRKLLGYLKSKMYVPECTVKINVEI